MNWSATSNAASRYGRAAAFPTANETAGLSARPRDPLLQQVDARQQRRAGAVADEVVEHFAAAAADIEDAEAGKRGDALPSQQREERLLASLEEITVRGVARRVALVEAGGGASGVGGADAFDLAHDSNSPLQRGAGQGDGVEAYPSTSACGPESRAVSAFLRFRALVWSPSFPERETW